jgi:sporulation protein YqfC
MTLQEKIVSSLELPRDLMFGAPIVSVTGNSEIVIANYKGILEYETSHIRIQTKTCRITVSGVKLTISYYTNEEMKILGVIQTISYEN